MKLKVWNKMLLVIGALLVLVIGAAMIVAAVTNVVAFDVISVIGMNAEQVGFNLGTAAEIALLVCGIVLVFYSLFAMLIPRKLRYNKHGFVIQKAENGDLRISVKAIESLVKRCIDMHDEINPMSMRILNSKKGVAVELHIALASNVSIPLAVASLQKQIKQYLLASSGIEVNHVSVTVETTKGGVKKPSPYTVTENTAPVQQEKVKKEKKPMHQRIFASKSENEEVKEAPAAPVQEAPVAEEAQEVPAADPAPQVEEPVAETAPQVEPEAEPVPEVEVEAPVQENQEVAVNE